MTVDYAALIAQAHELARPIAPSEDCCAASVAAVSDEGKVLPPCGRCREMMWQLDDHNKAATVILSEASVKPLEKLLPFR